MEVSKDVERAKRFASSKFIQSEDFDHSRDVFEVLCEFGFKDSGDGRIVMMGGWLHDIIENTNVSYHDLQQEFGQEVAETVFTVSDELGRNRKERKLKTYPKIKVDPRAIAVKVADRIANVKRCIKDNNSKLLSMYQEEEKEFEHELRLQEHFTFKGELGIDDNITAMWNHLRKLMNSTKKESLRTSASVHGSGIGYNKVCIKCKEFKESVIVIGITRVPLCDSCYKEEFKTDDPIGEIIQEKMKKFK